MSKANPAKTPMEANLKFPMEANLKFPVMKECQLSENIASKNW